MIIISYEHFAVKNYSLIPAYVPRPAIVCTDKHRPLVGFHFSENYVKKESLWRLSVGFIQIQGNGTPEATFFVMASL